MKINMILLAALLATPAVLAKEPVLVSMPPDWLNFYFQPELHFSEMTDDNAEMAGVEIGTTLNERWEFGVNWRTLINDVDMNKPGVEDPEAGDLMTVAGVVGYHLAPCSLLDATFKLDVGGGVLETGDDEDEVDFMLIEPSLDLGFNLSDGVVIGGTLGYRWVDGSDTDILRDEDLESFTGALYLRIDEF